MANCGGQKMAGSAAQLLRSSVFDATPPANTTLLPGVLRRADDGANEAALHIARRLLRGISRRMVLLDLILHAGKGECGPLHLDAEDLPVLRGPAQGVDVLAGRKRQAEQLAGPVDELTGGDVRRAADLLGMHAALPLRRDAQKLRRAAGKMPGQMRLVHQLHMAGAPQ